MRPNPSMSLAHLTIRELRDKLLDGECTALQATEACLERIAQVAGLLDKYGDAGNQS
ncbi:MAG: hypothetical protein IH801_08045, partial [Nitrospinae bacterium]|nr:hypothetical protein [Nitrospinota bacterium]